MIDVTSILSLLGQIAIVLLGGLCIVFLERLRQKAMDWYKQRKLHPIAKSVQANKKVNNLLIELRAKLDADRASVFLFHNGQVFSNKNPLWRVSCTQECCKTGVSHEIASLQNILASLFWDGLDPLFEQGATSVHGIQSFKLPTGQFVYVMDVHSMNDSFFKRSMITRGVSKKLICPLSDGKKEIVGYVALNYCSSEIMDLEEAKNCIAEVSGLIHFSLTEY